MDSPVGIVKRAPKWAIYATGGVVAGGLALRLYKNRTTADGATPAAGTTDATQIGAGPVYGPSSGAPGPIVPPTIIDNSAVDQSGTGLGMLQQLYTGGVQGVFDASQSLIYGLFGQSQQILDQQAALLNSSTNTVQQIALTAGAGAPPQPASIAPTPVVAYVPPPAPAPVAPAPQAFRVEYENRTRDNGLSGTRRVAWCNRVTIHRYPDGRGVVVDEQKIHNGAC